MNDLVPQIASDAADPAASTTDGQSATARPIADVIQADQYVKGAAALSPPNAQGGPRSGWGCLRTARAIPPGAV